MYRAKDTFWAPDNRRIVKGDLVAPHDPVVEGREGLFEEVVIPQAVAPAARPAAKKTAAKKTAASKAPAPQGDDGPEEKDAADGSEQE
ncbi:hypothetical protein HW846_46410 [Streptomyces sp. NE06-02F]|uniref:hypothetical protein n=1 Tax=Streptomyces caniscabiei TaxID=2746961 RepID=UPI0018729CDB|nr:hypothetical protein [Streptomyces caniscabiei]MBE4790680.1 hypothetical protein [Streptomyces caniscabiei]MDX2941028.1 hypothetical protein [Streptomyces caniscabiei]